MSAIPMKAYAETGLVAVETVNALLAFGEPMVSDRRGVAGYEGAPPYRAFLNWRAGGRTMGRADLTPQLAATALLEKLRGAR